MKQLSNSKALISLKLTLNISTQNPLQVVFYSVSPMTIRELQHPHETPGIRSTATMDDFYFLTILYLLKNLFLWIAAIKLENKPMVVSGCHLHVCFSSCSFMSLKSHFFVKTVGKGANRTSILIHFTKNVLRRHLQNQP